MKTAICFTGTGRSLEHTHLNLKENLIDCFSDSDVFILVAENPHSSKVLEAFKGCSRVKYIEIEEEPEPDISGLRFRPQWPASALSSREVYIKMIESRKRIGDIISKYESDNNFVYDRVIFSRLDVVYFDKVCKIVEELDMSALHVPDFHNEFGGAINGFNDRFAVGNRKDMDIYFKVPNSLIPFVSIGGHVHAETLLKWHMNVNKVKVLKAPIRFTRVRPDGKEEDRRIEKLCNWNFGDT